MSFIKKLGCIGVFSILSILFLCLLVHLKIDFVVRLHSKTLISTVFQLCSGQYCLHFYQTVHYIYHPMSFGFTKKETAHSTGFRKTLSMHWKKSAKVADRSCGSEEYLPYKEAP